MQTFTNLWSNFNPLKLFVKDLLLKTYDILEQIFMNFISITNLLQSNMFILCKLCKTVNIQTNF